MSFDAQKKVAPVETGADDPVIQDAVNGASAEVADRNDEQVNAALGEPTEADAIQQGVAATLQQQQTGEIADATPRDRLRANIEAAVAAWEHRTGQTRTKDIDDAVDAAAPALAAAPQPAAENVEDAAPGGDAPPAVADQPEEQQARPNATAIADDLDTTQSADQLV